MKLSIIMNAEPSRDYLRMRSVAGIPIVTLFTQFGLSLDLVNSLIERISDCQCDRNRYTVYGLGSFGTIFVRLFFWFCVYASLLLHIVVVSIPVDRV
jgi:hypothetical protein